MEKVSQHLIYVHRRRPILKTSTSPAGQSLLLPIRKTFNVRDCAKLGPTRRRVFHTRGRKIGQVFGRMCFKAG